MLWRFRRDKPWDYTEWWLAVILVAWSCWLLTHHYATWDAPGGALGLLGERTPLAILSLVAGGGALAAGAVRYDRGLAVAQTLALFVWAASGTSIWQASAASLAFPFLLTLWPWQVSVLAATLTRVRLDQARGGRVADSHTQGGA